MHVRVEKVELVKTTVSDYLGYSDPPEAVEADGAGVEGIHLVMPGIALVIGIPRTMEC